jgi:hypothetical protein
MSKIVLPKYSLLAATGLIFVALGLILVNQKQEIIRFEDDRDQVNNLLRGDQKVLGYTCGVLSVSVAKSLLARDVALQYGQGPTNRLPNGETTEGGVLYWVDSCRYQDPTNNSKYIEMYTSVFGSGPQAALAFPSFLQPVNQAVEIPAGEHGTRLMYDGGVYYLLTDNKIIQIAANNGGAEGIEVFSRRVFDKLMNH